MEKFESDKINIVAVNFPSYDFAREIAGECAEILMLLSPGEESHTFEPTPQDIILIQKADVFIAGGGESDAWVKKLISSSEIDKGKVLFMMEQDGINNIKASHEHFENHDHSEFYEYDEYTDSYTCSMHLDEDEMASFLGGFTKECKYYRFYDEGPEWEAGYKKYSEVVKTGQPL